MGQLLETCGQRCQERGDIVDDDVVALMEVDKQAAEFVRSRSSMLMAEAAELEGDVDGVPTLSTSSTKAPTSSRRLSSSKPACGHGTKCTKRDEDHLTGFVHPFDGEEYKTACELDGLTPEEPSLRGLFNWVDIDKSGKISRKELEAALPLLSKLFGEDIVLTQEAWEALDEDGNGCVNFSELAEWAGPRLGLPLGVKHLFSGRSSSMQMEGKSVDACGILGCPCEAYRPREEVKKKNKRRSWARVLHLTAKSTERMALCKCGHKHSAHAAEDIAGFGEVPFPSYWANGSGDFQVMLPVEASLLKTFQELFDGTYRNIWTRDRRKHNPKTPNVPKGYTVVRGFRCENSKFWKEYSVRRAQMIQDREESADPSAEWELYKDVKSATAWDGKMGGVQEDHPRQDCNEWYLFHGTNPKAAESICMNDFKISLAGGNTGTLYGRGVYFAESITKADEYAMSNGDGEFAVLLCRVLGGRVRYTAELQPDAEELVRSCIEGPYDCIMGDREKCRGTYREFVFYDSENVYAEYIIHYKRKT
eukprot:TRINITY_DN26018_c0_g1_i1.p1 TRINITY_DN26018_c0_g1~~TRINITY_DN26018_c0_g1_i1.p1  ORF type:complete len:534 (-),score=113.57 TRINITY_DN26018_c0_g1_i1:98-1699(-)